MDADERVREIRASIDTAETRRVHLSQWGASAEDLQPTVFFLATLRLFRDLVQQGWTAGIDDEGIFFLPPVLATAGADPSEAKSELRDSFQFVLADQLTSPPVMKFITRMERAGIDGLFARGTDLAARLERLRDGADMSAVIRPVLQLIDGNARDEKTGIKLQDVWRYARLQWSIPYQSTPGRNLHYLIRDAAAPGSPIVGIAALGNAILGLSQRDDALGWSSAALQRRFVGSTADERTTLINHLLSFLAAEETAIYRLDFDAERQGEQDILEFLAEVSRDSDASRKSDIGMAGENRTEEYNRIRVVHNRAAAGTATDEDWAEVARTHLYRRKRAGALAEIIRTRAVFDGAELAANPDVLLELLATEEGRRAIDATLRRVKQRAIAENVMEIITCGAVAPYNQILGGKLVSMLMASPQVVADVRARYEGKVSLIASGMAGRAIVREPALSLLTTSSLYAMGSAQYNRIRIPGSVVDGGAGEVRFDRIGVTDSYGTVQFASDTTQELVRVARFANENRRMVNNLFGEGMSPKLRSLRMGLEGLGLRAEEYLRHHSPRLLYAVPLASNSRDVLLGLARPDYVLPVDAGEEASTAIAQHWFQRWAASRVDREDTIIKIRATRPDAHLLSRLARELTASTVPQATSFEPREETSVTEVLNSGGPISFVEKLYRNTNSYADRLSQEELDWIHVDLGVDEFILGEASKAKQIVITGNPGDGKTFAIERLRAQLEHIGAVVITDANAFEDGQVLAAWRSCEDNGRPFVLAINEWPLFELQRLAAREDFTPVAEAIRQVRSAVFFGPEPEPRKGRVTVIDLNLRNVLAGRVVSTALGRLTAGRFTQDLNAVDPARVNAERLTHERVQQRLAALLEHAARLGQHTTMRQLMGFLAYLLTGGTDATTRIMSQESGRYLYSSLAFDPAADGALFQLVRRAFDPATVTHPAWDEALWRGTTDPSDWLDGDVPAAAAGCPSAERDECFRTAKRRFFFEHTNGADLLQMIPSDEIEFDDVLSQGLVGDAELVRRVVLAINRFFEPDADRDEERQLKLWQSHRYDVRPPTAFIALHAERSDDLSAKAPLHAEWVRAWLAEDLTSRGHFAIEADSVGANPSRLLIDRDLFLTLREAAAGLGRSTWSRSVARKVTRFVDGLHRRAHEPRALSDLEIRNVDTNLRAVIKVHRDARKFEL
ncbi:Druantia anti-phage system protein DruA [Microbacterium sp.]|uniref:Druantia anti-phage system protein DruA n=1 Tax=Microbacterium sp. TaxID=51671 RepID=UPI003A939019